VTHLVLAIGIALAGGLAFCPGYKVHRKGWILVLFLLGIALISAAAALGEPVLSAYGETGITVFGSLLLITAHWCNRSFCHSCAVDRCLQTRLRALVLPGLAAVCFVRAALSARLRGRPIRVPE
jgi:hypothetical protein